MQNVDFDSSDSSQAGLRDAASSDGDSPRAKPPAADTAPPPNGSKSGPLEF